MKIRKSVAGIAATTIVATGLIAVGTATPALAASGTFPIYQNIKNYTLQPTPTNEGNKNVSITVSPATAATGAPITITVSSTDLPFTNGPAATVKTEWSEIGAVVSLNGQDYLLRGSRNAIDAPATETIFDPGWSISSTPGASSAATTNTNGVAVPGTTGEGAFKVLSYTPYSTTPIGTPPAIPGPGAPANAAAGAAIDATATTLTAPAVAGTYEVVLKALVNNSVSDVYGDGTGSGVVNITDNFDDVYNVGGTGQPFAKFASQDSTAWFDFDSGTAGAQGATLVAEGPVFDVTKVAHNGATVANGVGVGTDSLGDALAFVRQGDVVTIDGNDKWATTSNNFVLRLCPSATAATSTTGCSPGATSAAVFPPVTPLSQTAGDLSTGAYTLANLNDFTTGLPLSGTGYSIRLEQTSGPYTGFAPPFPTVLKVAAFPLNILGTATIDGPSPVSPGGSANVTGSNWYPNETVTVTAGTASISGTADGFGAVDVNLTMSDSSATSYDASGSNGGVTAQDTTLAFNSDRCTAYIGNLTGGPGCDTAQELNASVTAGNLTQRAYASGANPDATTVELGSIQTPLAPTAMPAKPLNNITVTDARGGLNGWSLTASMVNLSAGVGGPTIDKAQVSITPSCTPADDTNAWDYNDPGQVVIPGFDPSLNAPNATAGSTEDFGAGNGAGGAVTLCTKNSDPNAITQSSGGVYTVGGAIVLTVPAFQQAANYSGLMTITLA